jgi:polysaccharide biosynthesis transport protein
VSLNQSQDPLPSSLPSASVTLGEEEEVLGFDFSRYITALRKYAWVLVAIIAVAITASVLYTRRLTKIYSATASVQIDPRLPDLLGQGQDGMNAGGNTGTLEYYKQQLKILSSYKLIRLTVENGMRDGHLERKLLSEKQRGELKPDEQIDLATAMLQAALSVKYPNLDRTMYVSVRSASPQDAADLANAHLKTYDAYSRGLISTNSDKASEALSTEFEQVETNLRKSQEALDDFQKVNKIEAIALQDQQNLVVSNISSFTQKVNDAKGVRIELGNRLKLIRAASNVDVLSSPLLTIADVSSFDSLRAQYYTERNALKALSSSVGPKTLEYKTQKEKVDDLLDALQNENRRQVAGAEAQFSGAMATEQSLQSEVNRAKQEAVELKPKIDKYNELVRERAKFDDRYKILVARLSTSEMTGRMNKQMDTNVHLLDPALVPTEPVSPSLRTNVAIAGSGALMLGLGLISLLVFLDRSIKSTLDAQQSAGVPVLGVIPVLAESDLPRDDDRARDLYVHEHPKSRVAECCRSLRTNIMFSAAERRLKTLVVTSANPREGKTTSVIYLGTTLAQSGQRVLLIDTDMRRPRLHSSTGVSRDAGLSNLMLGDENYDEVIGKTDIPNLFVLPCGPLPPNPAELLMTKRFGHVLEELSKRFDRIILDSPPLGAVTDAVVLSKQVDGCILVVRAGKTLRDEIKRSAKQIRDVGGGIFGVIVNELDTSDKGAYYYSYYGYGPDPKDEKKSNRAA